VRRNGIEPDPGVALKRNILVDTVVLHQKFSITVNRGPAIFNVERYSPRRTRRARRYFCLQLTLRGLRSGKSLLKCRRFISALRIAISRSDDRSYNYVM
jgi:hypothetical protein